MKKVILLNLALISVALLHGQTIENEIKNAEKLLKQKSYKEAVQSLNNAIKEIELKYLAELTSELLPVKYSDLNLKIDHNQSIIDKNLIRITAIYNNQKGIDSVNINSNSMSSSNPQIFVTISNEPNKATEVASAHSGSSGYLSPDDEYVNEPIRIKDYRATKQFNKNSRQGRISVIIGGATIELIGSDIENIKDLQDFIDKISFEKVIQIFGL
jgi:hypothetical protein